MAHAASLCIGIDIRDEQDKDGEQQRDDGAADEELDVEPRLAEKPDRRTKHDDCSDPDGKDIAELGNDGQLLTQTAHTALLSFR